MTDTAEDPAGDPATYVVTDIEIDGFWPGANSMRSFASVAVTAGGETLGEFEAVLEPLPGAAPNVDTFAWFQTQPEAWAAATTDPSPVPGVMADFVTWLQGLPAPRIFVAHPVAFDGGWIDHYLRRFTRYGVAQGPDEADRLFADTLCVRSYAAAVLGRPVTQLSAATYPPGWLGDIPHTHRAIDDARGYAHLLGVLLDLSRR